MSISSWFVSFFYLFSLSVGVDNDLDGPVIVNLSIDIYEYGFIGGWFGYFLIIFLIDEVGGVVFVLSLMEEEDCFSCRVVYSCIESCLGKSGST